MPAASWKFCQSGRWTDISNGPTFGFIYVDSRVPVTVRWRRYSSGIPWYMEGTANLQVGQNTLVNGGPSLYCRIEVNPVTSVELFGH